MLPISTRLQYDSRRNKSDFATIYMGDNHSATSKRTTANTRPKKVHGTAKVIDHAADCENVAAWAEEGGGVKPAKKLLLPEPLKPTMLLCIGLSGPHCVFSRYDLKPWILTNLIYMGALLFAFTSQLRTNPPQQDKS